MRCSKKNSEIIADYSREAVKKWPKKVHQDILMLQIMEEMGWTYKEYQETPARILDLIIQKKQIDYKTKQWQTKT